MKTNSITVLCLSLLLLHFPFSLAKRGGGGGGGGGSKSSWNRGSTTSNRGGSNTNTNTNTGGSTSHSGNTGSRGNRPQGGGGGGSHHQRHPPRHGSPYGGGHGGVGTHGGYSGVYINRHPNNQILSPRYGTWGYGGYVERGSPFSNSVWKMGKTPNDRSRSFGRTAAMAAAVGPVRGMALGYGLGTFPRPHFHLQSHQQEYYYNHYMYTKYGGRSTDTKDYSRDYRYVPPPVQFDEWMKSCMNRTKSEKPQTRTTVTTTTITSTTTVLSSASDTSSNSTKTNNTAANNSSSSSSSSSTSAPSTPRPLNQLEASPVPPTPQVLTEYDDTVSIEEIGYPALIEQLKGRRCLEEYIQQSYSTEFQVKSSGEALEPERSVRGILAVFTSTLLMLLNTNMLILLH